MQRRQTLLRGSAKFAVVVVGGLTIGVGIGFGASAIRGDGAPARVTAATEPASNTTLPEARVIATTFDLARSEDGRHRNRARLSIRVQLTNPTGEELAPKRPELVVPDGRTPADPNADSFAGGLLEPIAPSASATGTLRFETAGTITQNLIDDRRGTLEIAGRSVVVALPTEGG